MSPIMPQEAMGGAVPQAQAQGQNPSPQGQTPKLPPEQMEALRQDPEIKQAVSKFIGRPVKLESVPDNILIVVAGMVHKLGVDGAIQKFEQMVTPEIKNQLRAGK